MSLDDPTEDQGCLTPQEAGLTPDQNAAHQFLAELRTRIATQRLPYQHGVEKGALESLYAIFGQARATIRDNPGCEEFSDIAVRLLNKEIRPVTAKWHRLGSRGLLDSRDGADAFREDLAALQTNLATYLREFRRLAYGNEEEDEILAGPFEGKLLEELFEESIAYGIPKKDQIAAMAKTLSAKGIEVSGVEDINRAEKETLESHRKAVREMAEGEGTEVESPGEGIDAVGLACSGGGVRSATFSLGVIQILADKGLLKDIDFLSTVSGGGFTGAFLTRRLELPDSEKSVGGAYGPDPEPIRYLRQRAKYLTSQSLWDAWGMVTSTIAGMMINWMVPIMIIAALAVVTVWGERFEFWKRFESEIYLGLGLATFATALAFFFSLRGSEKVSKWTGWAFAASAAVLFLGVAWKAVTEVYYLFFSGKTLYTTGDIFEDLGDSEVVEWFGAGSLGIGSVAVLLPAVLKFVPVFKNPRFMAILQRVALILAGLFLPIAGLALYLFLCAVAMVVTFPIGDAFNFPGGGFGFLIALSAFLFVLSYFFLNINLTAPHRLYRNGLAGTFVRDGEHGSDFVELAKINQYENKDGLVCPGFAPYHLINAAANLPNSSSPGLRERLCDFYLFSKHYCGSPVIGFRPTAEWKMNGKPADLASAMAISGAAVSSNMGLSSIRPLRALLTFLNVRLGFWIRRPQMPALLGTRGSHPGFSFLLREMLGVAMSEKQRWVNLSDGGHIENLAVYELLRRRCKFIICIDGEGDPGFWFRGLVTLVRHARIDLGVRIAPDLTELRRDAESGHSRHHNHLCRIHYPELDDAHPAATGLLLYVKLSTTGNESELIRRYQGQNPDFPHQTTADQFFDEEQFEAYRQLGAHAGNGLFAPCLTNGNTDPKSVRSWFKSLSQNLLLPE